MDDQLAENPTPVRLTDEQVMGVVITDGILDCLTDPYDKHSTGNGNEYGSLLDDAIRLVRATETAVLRANSFKVENEKEMTEDDFFENVRCVEIIKRLQADNDTLRAQLTGATSVANRKGLALELIEHNDTRLYHEADALMFEASNEITRLEHDNEILRSQLDTLQTTIAAAQIAMAGAPIWSQGHRDAIAMLNVMRDVFNPRKKGGGGGGLEMSRNELGGEVNHDHLTKEHARALIDFKTKHGRRWKDKLKRLWATGKDERHPDGALLREVRNEIGPVDLDKVVVGEYHVDWFDTADMTTAAM
jgi:hypothetical protein